jgi:hypothetical protein
VIKLRGSLVALVVVSICACGQSTVSPVSVSTATPKVVTLESISAQPGDLPAVGLQKCTTGSFISGTVNTATPALPDEWKTVQAAGATEGWVQWLTAACPGERTKARVRNDVIRFSDAAAATAFFKSEKANAQTTAIFWPIGGIAKEGSASGLGANSVSMVINDASYCALWTNGSLLISYCLVNFASTNGINGALAVNARVP